MDDAKEENKEGSVSYHRPEWNEQGEAIYTVLSQPKEKNHIATLLKVAEKVIPVIFIPGVMGTNLKNSNREVWRDSAKSLGKWLITGPEKRKRLLDPKTTTVDLSGDIFNAFADGRRFPSRRDRGWGAAFYMSYGEPLDKLQALLNDDHILLDNFFTEHKRQTTRQQFIDVAMDAEKGEAPMTEQEVRHSYDFAYPLHVFGYNWLQSNADSALRLGKYIDETLDRYARRLAVRKVILITHSMGGLVARHYSENLAGREHILGMVHGVMPDLGSPTAYRRMKTGERGRLGLVLGNDASHLMPVLAQSPGPLQLLPSIAYGPGWLKIQHRDGSVEHKPLSDPYEEIYLNHSHWWRLCEQELLLDNTAQEWSDFSDRIKKDVREFIEELHGKYHPQTWAFYGASDQQASDDHLIWQETPRTPYYGTVSGLPTILSATQRKTDGTVFTLTSSGSAGDGTVPVRSGRLTAPAIQSLLATDIAHEAAYAIHPVDGSCALSRALLFTLRAVVKIVQQVPPP